MGPAALPADDRGSIVPLILGFAVLLLLLITVIAGASRLFLVERALSAAADGAASAAAESLDESAYYARRGVGGPVRLSESHVTSTVQQYVDEAGLRSRFDSLTISPELSVDGTTVTVTARAYVRLPLVNALTSGAAGQQGYPVEVSASARTPVAP